jgi:hypothetical protein
VLDDIKGCNINVQLIDNFLAKRNIRRCLDFKDTIEIILKVLSPFITYSSG